MTATVKAMDSQRWVCRTHLFQFNGTSSFSAELFCVLGGQSLPIVELHGFGADDASDRLTGEKVI